MLRQRPRFDAAGFIEFAKMRHRLLNDAPPDPHAAHQPPIAAYLAVLSKRRVAQIHRGESKYDPPIRENTLGWHYMPKSAPRARLRAPADCDH
jgi:hypothetical protein